MKKFAFYIDSELNCNYYDVAIGGRSFLWSVRQYYEHMYAMLQYTYEYMDINKFLISGKGFCVTVYIYSHELAFPIIADGFPYSISVYPPDKF